LRTLLTIGSAGAAPAATGGAAAAGGVAEEAPKEEEKEEEKEESDDDVLSFKEFADFRWASVCLIRVVLRLTVNGEYVTLRLAESNRAFHSIHSE
jgi:hypothetical protein